jgi:hypothetical protein
VTVERFIRRAVGLVVHNWPLKLAAIVLATLLYAGLVASQDSSTIQGPVTVTVQNQPPDTVITNQLRDVDSIRYIAPAGSQRPRARRLPGDDRPHQRQARRRAVNVPVRVTALDPDITIIDVTPRTIQVVLESSSSKVVPVRVERGPAPEGIDVGETTYDPETVTVRGASRRLPASSRPRWSSRSIPGLRRGPRGRGHPVDANGDLVTGIDVEPATVHVQIPLFTDKESRTLPVNPVIAGSPAPGFRIAGVAVNPATVTVEGDAEQLTTLVQVDTAPVSVAGATADVTQTVALTPPNGISTTSAAPSRSR